MEPSSLARLSLAHLKQAASVRGRVNRWWAGTKEFTYASRGRSFLQVAGSLWGRRRPCARWFWAGSATHGLVHRIAVATLGVSAPWPAVLFAVGALYFPHAAL